jgi:hypothetical protein
MDLLVKSSGDLATVAQKARLELDQLEGRLMEMFESEISRIDQKSQAKYFNYIFSKPTSLLKQHFPYSQPAADTRPQLQTTLKRSRSAFGLEDATLPSYGSAEQPDNREVAVFLHADASPPSVRPRVSVTLTPQSPKAVLQFTPAAEPSFELPRMASEPKSDDQYSMTSYSETDAEHKSEQDERRRKRRVKKRIPEWCKDWQYLAKMQQNIDPDTVFYTLKCFPKCDLNKVFGENEKYSDMKPKKHRGSSGNWGVDGLTDVEIINYKKLMGQISTDKIDFSF